MALLLQPGFSFLSFFLALPVRCSCFEHSPSTKLLLTKDIIIHYRRYLANFSIVALLLLPKFRPVNFNNKAQTDAPSCPGRKNFPFAFGGLAM